MRYAFQLAERKEKRKVTAVDKKNVISHMYGLWRETFERVAKSWPAIETEYNFADAINMWLVKNPEKYEVVVTPNLFGDILTDLGAAITGGLGFAAGANINPEGVSMFEPIHGSAPKYKGTNTANPIATILSGALMLDTIGEPEMAALVERAVEEVMREGAVRTRDMGGDAGTNQMGEAVARKVLELGKGL
jgi:3-isopropylmalate dehydrogenase